MGTILFLRIANKFKVKNSIPNVFVIAVERSVTVKFSVFNFKNSRLLRNNKKLYSLPKTIHCNSLVRLH